MTLQLPPQTIMMMIAVVVVAVLLLSVMLGEPRPRYIRKSLMTPNEAEFFWRLRRALPAMQIFPQVAMSALIDPAARGEKRRKSQFWKIGLKRCDYIVCNAELQVVAVIELDDRTHDATKDAIRDGYLSSAGIATIRFHSRNKPDATVIQQRVAEIVASRQAEPA